MIKFNMPVPPPVIDGRKMKNCGGDARIVWDNLFDPSRFSPKKFSCLDFSYDYYATTSTGIDNQNASPSKEGLHMAHAPDAKYVSTKTNTESGSPYSNPKNFYDSVGWRVFK